MPHRIPHIPPIGPTAATVVEARALRKVHGEGEAQVVALDTVSLIITEGEFVSIMGPSGSGKSTLLHCLAGLDTPTSGSVLIAGRDLSGMRDKQLTAVRRDQLGFIFQSFNLLPTLSAEENILLPQRLAHRKPDRDWYDAVISVLGLSERLTHRPSELSGGQQQRVAVARALVGRPKVVFADEPTGALDTASAANLLQTLARMCETLGQTVVMVTHDQDAAATTNRIIRLRDGRIIGDQPTRRSAGARAATLGAHHAVQPVPVTPAQAAPPVAPMTAPTAQAAPHAGYDAPMSSVAPTPVRRVITPAAAPESRRVSRPSTTPAAPAPQPTAVYSARHAAAPSATHMFGVGSPHTTGMEAR
ncbi:ABC transporter ATP-binding protein [Actinomyces bowdenii]|uniref:ABC transporter ATP-binding protein n=1 Tax=Actinomyces bowdenii TaxID=131109 RepID=UPI00214CC336|nr:ABC transporter ATP-binding protein [Actinomyces bowdenii]MCR2052376.1 ABC transporter ATP-binding protein [Actinomyces bowdenii]